MTKILSLIICISLICNTPLSLIPVMAMEEETPEETEETDFEEEADLSILALPEAEIVSYVDLNEYVSAVSELNCAYGTDNEATLVIDTSSGEVLTESGEVLERAGEAVMEAASLTAEEAVECLETSEYEVLDVEGDAVVISNPYESARLLVTSENGVDTSGAVSVISFENEYILQYASSGDAAQAAGLLAGSVDSLDVDAPMDVAEEEDWVYEAEAWFDSLEADMSADNIASGDQGRFENQTKYLSWAVSYLGIDDVLDSYSEEAAQEIVVAVIDSGFDNVEGFFSDERILGPLTVCSNGDTSDCNSSKHGTFVLGQIYEATPSNVKLLPVRAYNDNGGLTTSQLKTALTLIEQYEKDSSVQVSLVNISLGTSGSSGESFTGSSIDKVISAMNGEGTFFIASAGNSARTVKENYPAKSSYVCAVSAINNSGYFASAFSNYADDDDPVTYSIAYSAPGTSITGVSSASSTGLTTMQGTSMASPNATACAAILRSQGKLTGITSVDVFISSLNNYVNADLTAGTDSKYYGAGCLGFPADIGFTELSIKNYYCNYVDDQLYQVKPASYQNGLTVTTGNDTLVKDVDYTVTYENNTDPGVATATVTGKGIYDGTVTGTFRIYGKITDCEVNVPNAVYTGSAITPEVEVLFHGTRLVKDTDYTLAYENNTNVGTATVTITGIGNYLLTKKVSFDIAPCNITNVTVSEIPAQLYTGESIEPELTVSINGVVLCKDVDYTVAYENNILPGLATALVAGIGGFDSEQAVVFDIKVSINDCEVSALSDVTYTGSAIEPEMVVTFQGNTLQKDVDYTISYKDNIYPGEAACVLTGIGSYTGEMTIPYSIIGDFTACTVEAIADQNFTGAAIVPDLAVTFNGQTLTGDVDYVISCTNNIRPGYAACVLTGKGFYQGEIETGFTIKGDITACKVSGLKDYAYTGKTLKPEPVVTLCGIVLKKGTDYKLSYSNNTAVGKAWCTVKGIGAWEGEMKTSFIIYGKMAESEAGSLSDVNYTGKAIKPLPKVTFKGTTLLEGTHYTLSYKNNTEPGTASCIVTGIAPYYVGTLEISFDINLRTTYFTSLKNVKSGVKMTWKVLPEVDGYLIYRKNGSGSFKYLATASGARTVSYTDQSAQSGVTYTYMIKSYVEDDGIKIKAGKYTASLLCLAPPNVKISNAKTGISLSWSSVKGAGGYIVYRKDGEKSEAGTYKKIKTLKGASKVSFTDQTAESGSTYTYRVITYKGSIQSGFTNKQFFRLDGTSCSCSNKISGIKVTWNKVKGADGYYIYRKKTSEKTYTRIGKTSANCRYYYDRDAENGGKYRYQVKAYNGSYISAYYAYAFSTHLIRGAISSLKSLNTNTITVNWKKNAKVSGYQVCYAANSSFKKAVTVSVKGKSTLTWTIKGLKSGTKYYVKVRSYRTVNGKRYHSAWSAVKKVTVQ